ncbi:ABC transporter permease [Anaerosphaera multitolerans]|uniref:ABC transporter permease n=1 Tax=Anaerosphaera multitolerans TaxID=2487351 RepID=A0A437S8V1_9FIRM|nr:ABC transporter permease [Anaerosphaera multitolerans]RVU55442.1 ABC transporter permease [Anaerosphaera multitolerans]
MKRIWNILQLDIKLISRDKIMGYIILAPVIMAFVITFVVSFVDDTTTTLYVTKNVPSDVLDSLQEVAYIEEVENLEILKNRINAFDNVAGIYTEEGEIHLMLQGNEGSKFEKEISIVVNDALKIDTPRFEFIDYSNSMGWIMNIITAALLITPPFIGGVIGGFNMVTEKETKMNLGYRITPLSYLNNIISRTILAMLIGFIVLVLITIVIGQFSKLPLILLSTLFAMPMFTVMPIVIGVFARDKMEAITLFKVLMIVFLIFPITSEFVPKNFKFLYWPFPMFWQYQTILNTLDNNFSFFSGFMSFFTGVIMLGIILVIFRKKFKIEIGNKKQDYLNGF